MAIKPELCSKVANLEAALEDAFFPLRVTDIAGRTLFAAHVETRDLGWLRVTQASVKADTYRSKLAHVSALDPKQYVLQFTQSGSLRFHGNGIETSCGSESLVLLAPTRYFEVDQSGPSEAISLALPGGLLRAQIRDIDSRCFAAVSARNGTAAMLRSLMLDIWEQRTSLSKSDAESISNAVVSLLRRAISSPDDAASTAAAFATKMHELEEVIARNLQREDLSPDMIANEMSISKSYVFALAAQLNTTVRKLIMRKRLERCRDALLDPALSQTSLTEIAFSWGFQDMSHFSRRFKERYGSCPSEFRIRPGEVPTTVVPMTIDGPGVNGAMGPAS